MQKKKYIVIFLIIFLILQIFWTSPMMATNNFNMKKVVNKKVDNKEIDDNASNYSDAYKSWLKLSETDKAKSAVIPRKYNIPLDEIYEDTVTVKEKPSLFNLFGLLSKEKTTYVYANEIPEEYDLRDEINILVENQNTEGLCWAFASLTSLETNLAINKYGNYDFSERHVDYLTSYDFGGTRQLGKGGNFENFADYVAKNNGPILEETVPYNNVYTSEQYEYLDNLKSQVYVTEKIDFPTIDKLNYIYSEEELELFRDKVKMHIVKNGSIYVNVLGTGVKSVLIQNGTDYTLYNTTGNVDHALSIIGWNDNYPKENFQDNNGNTPKNNGAYIALNSWGENIQIIYISYEDYTVEREMSGIVSATTDINEIGNMQVTFNDQNLYNFMKTNYRKAIISSDDKTKNINFLGYLNTLQIILDISRQNISDLSGLEKFRLEILSAYSNKISDINMLKDLTEMYFLDVRDNNISNINALENLTNLRALYMDYNSVSNLSVLKDMKKLNILSAADNEITDVSVLTNLTNLNYLDLQNNNISNINVLENLTNLKTLDLGSNNISDISKLSSLTNLIMLNLEFNKISNINALANLTNLEYLGITSNKVCDISLVGNLTKLTEFWASYNNISNIDSLNSLESLEILVLGYNNIEDISVLENLKNLEHVSLSYNNINKEITLTEDEIVTVMLPNIIQEAQNTESIIYSEEGINLQNCNLSEDKTSVNIDTNMYSNATVTINSGAAQGTCFNILVTKNATKIAIKELPKTTYPKGENLDITGGIITVTYEDGNTEDIPMTDSKVTVSGYDKDKLGMQAITIKYEKFTINFTVTVVEKMQIQSNKYTIIEDNELSIIRGIMPQITLLKLKENIQSNTTYEILNLNNNKITNTEKIGTGYKLKTTDGKTYTLIVYGDITGDGEISISELAAAARAATGVNLSIEKVKFMAIDINNDGNIKVSDLSVISRLKNK